VITGSTNSRSTGTRAWPTCSPMNAHNADPELRSQGAFVRYVRRGCRSTA
jgi:hypothetical protein